MVAVAVGSKIPAAGGAVGEQLITRSSSPVPQLWKVPDAPRLSQMCPPLRLRRGQIMKPAITREALCTEPLQLLPSSWPRALLWAGFHDENMFMDLMKTKNHYLELPKVLS